MITLVVVVTCIYCTPPTPMPMPTFQQFQFPEPCESAAEIISDAYFGNERWKVSAWCVAADGSMTSRGPTKKEQ